MRNDVKHTRPTYCISHIYHTVEIKVADWLTIIIVLNVFAHNITGKPDVANGWCDKYEQAVSLTGKQFSKLLNLSLKLTKMSAVVLRLRWMTESYNVLKNDTRQICLISVLRWKITADLYHAEAVVYCQWHVAQCVTSIGILLFYLKVWLRNMQAYCEYWYNAIKLVLQKLFSSSHYQHHPLTVTSHGGQAHIPYTSYSIYNCQQSDQNANYINHFT